MAADLEFMESRLPQRAAARTPRQALAEHYGASPDGAVSGSRRPLGLVPGVGSPARRAVLSGSGMWVVVSHHNLPCLTQGVV